MIAARYRRSAGTARGGDNPDSGSPCDSELTHVDSRCLTVAENLFRTANFTAGTGRELYGVAVPFGVTQQVADRDGHPYREQFAPGAFKRTIAERGHKIRLFAQHDRSRLPVGKATELREQADGLHVRFEVANTSDGDDLLELVRAGVVDSFSIAFQPVRERNDNGVVVRTEVALREISVVSDPAYPTAQIAGVRSEQETLTIHRSRAEAWMLTL